MNLFVDPGNSGIGGYLSLANKRLVKDISKRDFYLSISNLAAFAGEAEGISGPKGYLSKKLRETLHPSLISDPLPKNIFCSQVVLSSFLNTTF